MVYFEVKVASLRKEASREMLAANCDEQAATWARRSADWNETVREKETLM